MKSLALAFAVAMFAIVGAAGDSFPDFDAETITGDGLVALCRKINRPLTAEDVDSLRERLDVAIHARPEVRREVRRVCGRA